MKKSSLFARAASLARHARRGFTLVEILIVLAIIGILAAILFPVFSNAREGGRSATCSSNLKQIGLAINQYVQDSGGFYPNLQVGMLPRPATECGWADRVYPYLRSTQVFKCPSFSRGEFRLGCPPPPDKATDGSDYPDTWDGSYNLTDGKALRSESNLVSAVRVKKPSGWIMAYDGTGGEGELVNLSASRLQGFVDEGYARHRGGLNALFFDNHVKRLSFDEITQEHYWR